MISSDGQEKMLGTSAIENSSDAAGLLDEEFMNQFAPIDPQDYYYQADLDAWFSGNLTNDPNTVLDGTHIFEDFSQAVEEPFHQILDTTNDLQPYPAEDTRYASQLFENTLDVNGIDRNIPHLPSIEQVLSNTLQPEAHTTPSMQQVVFDANQPDSLKTQQKETSPYDMNQFESLDKDREALQSSLQYIRDFEELFGIPPEAQCNDLFDGLVTVESDQMQPAGLHQDTLNQVDDFDHVSSGSLHQHDEKLGAKSRTSSSNTSWKKQHESVPKELHVSRGSPHESTSAKSERIERPPLPLKVEKAQRKEPRNTRRANMESIDPSQYYEKLSEPPCTWSPHDSNATTIFHYDEYGELASNDRFLPEEIYQYLFHHPLNYDRFGTYDIEHSRLILWIQVTPADSEKRYPYMGSSKCRFQDCPAPQNTIRKGFFRVAFDETTATGRRINPYHCAAFVHLFCLEKFCDFPAICQKLNVLPDRRSLPEGRNKMAITRDHHEMIEIVDTFMKSSQTLAIWDYEKTLCFQLTSKHLELEPNGRKILRAARGGNHIAMHLGDLDKFAEGERHKVARQRLTGRAPKRKREVDDEEKVEESLTKQDIRPHKRRYRFR